jgi:hypothetical protein
MDTWRDSGFPFSHLGQTGTFSVLTVLEKKL